MNFFRVRIRAIALAFAALGACTCGRAQEKNDEGWYLGTEAYSAYDSNVTREPSGKGAAGSQIDSAGLIAGLDRTYDRQHVSASVDVGRVLYRSEALSYYDFTQQDIRLALKSSLPAGIETLIDAKRTNELANPANLAIVEGGKFVPDTRRNVIATDGLKGAVYFPLFSQNWRAVASAIVTRSRNSDALDRPTDLNTIEGDAGVRYTTGAANFVDLLARDEHATYPNAQLSPFQDTSYSDRGIDLRTQWRLSGFSSVEGHVGYDERRNANLTFLNFSGPAYDLTYTWKPLYKTSLALLVLRQSGAIGQAGFLAATTHTYRVQPAYQPTDSTRIELHYQWSHVDYLADVQALEFGLPANLNRIDSDNDVGLVATWQVRRWLGLRLSTSREQRTSNTPGFEFVDRYSKLQVDLKI
jgi:hypothetical protein